jgi:predicted SnoaL-like aldol condensation-catalyzing enzyme
MWFKRVWNQNDESAIDDLLAPSALARGLANPDGSEVRGPTEFKRFARDFRARVPDIRIEVTQTISEGEMCAAHCDVRGTHQATNTPIHFTGVALCRVRDGQIQEAWNVFDFLSFFEQTGEVRRVSRALPAAE